MSMMHARVSSSAAHMTYSCLLSKLLKNYPNPVNKGEMKNDRMKFIRLSDLFISISFCDGRYEFRFRIHLRTLAMLLSN